MTMLNWKDKQKKTFFFLFPNGIVWRQWVTLKKKKEIKFIYPVDASLIIILQSWILYPWTQYFGTCPKMVFRSAHIGYKRYGTLHKRYKILSFRFGVQSVLTPRNLVLKPCKNIEALWFASLINFSATHVRKPARYNVTVSSGAADRRREPLTAASVRARQRVGRRN